MHGVAVLGLACHACKREYSGFLSIVRCAVIVLGDFGDSIRGEGGLGYWKGRIRGG